MVQNEAIFSGEFPILCPCVLYIEASEFDGGESLASVTELFLNLDVLFSKTVCELK